MTSLAPNINAVLHAQDKFSLSYIPDSLIFPGCECFLTVLQVSLVVLVPTSLILELGATIESASSIFEKAKNHKKIKQRSITLVLPIHSMIFVPFGWIPMVTGVRLSKSDGDNATVLLYAHAIVERC